MNITKIAIDNNRLTYMMIFVIVIMGVVAYSNFARDDMPPFTIRAASVITYFPGASPERVESLVTDKIEKVVQEIPEVDHITSESRTSLSSISVRLKDEVQQQELQPIWDLLRRKIQSIASELPDGIQGPDVKDDNLGTVYGIVIGLLGDGFEYNELKSYADQIRDEIIKLPDAARVEINGAQEEQVFIEFDNAKLSQIGLTSGQLQNIISSTNILFPGGKVSMDDERVILEPTGNFETIEDLSKTLIPVGQTGTNVYLGDITTISRGYKNPKESLVKINGIDGLTLAVSLKKGANIVKLGEEVDKKIAMFNQTLPVGIQLSRAASQDIVVEESVSDFLMNLIQSVAIVLLVMLIFLGFRTGIVVASLIPTAILMALFVMGLFDIGLNKVSLAALIMALGMLVDNAIVMSESIMVKMEKGMASINAAISSCKELMLPLFIATLTTSAAFLAFYLAESAMGEIISPLFTVITITLLSSWILSLTLIPMLAVQFIKIDKKSEGNTAGSLFDRINVHYKKILLAVMRRPAIFLVSIFLILVGSIMLFRYIPFIFFPESERNLVTLNLNLPLGTKIEKTEAVAAQIDEYIKQKLWIENGHQTGITDWASFIGKGPSSYDLGYQPGEANSGYVHMLLNTRSSEDNAEIIVHLDNFCRQQLPDAEVQVKLLSGGGGSGVPVQVRVFGKSPDELFSLSDQIKQKLISIPGTKNVSDDWGPRIKKLVIDIDPTRAQIAGLSNQDIALSLQTALTGFNTGEFREGENAIPIIMRSENSQEWDVQSLKNLNLFAQSSGRNVPLQQVAEIVPQWQYAKIKRRDLFRVMTINAYLKEGYTASDITQVLTPWLEEQQKSWQPAYYYELGGESEDSAKGLLSVAENLPIAGFIILMLLVSQFNSIRKTTIVLSTIPLGLIGVILGLLIFQSYFGFFGFLAIISLAGIVINNAIVLIDRIKIEMEEFNRKQWEAIVAAAQQRFRPILLTTFTTTLGLIPLYLGGGLMWEPMAIGIMIGLLFATVITLLFVPVLYQLLFGVKETADSAV